jgi:hypothetical protein
MASMGLDVAGGRKNRLKKGVGGGGKAVGFDLVDCLLPTLP